MTTSPRPSWPRAVIALALLAMLAATPACGAEGSECASHDECNDGLFCRGPNVGQTCGIPPRELCSADAECDPSMACHAIADPCSADEIGSECLLKCDATRGCGTGFTCDLSRGACVPVLCNAGFTCPVQQTCDPTQVNASGPVHALHHGCVDVACTGDGGCPSDQRCVNGRCQTGIGFCREATPVP